MITKKTQLTDESSERRALFRALFLFQIELEKHNKKTVYREEVCTVIESIDRLMTSLLESS